MIEYCVIKGNICVSCRLFSEGLLSVFEAYFGEGLVY